MCLTRTARNTLEQTSSLRCSWQQNPSDTKKPPVERETFGMAPSSPIYKSVKKGSRSEMKKGGTKFNAIHKYPRICFRTRQGLFCWSTIPIVHENVSPGTCISLDFFFFFQARKPPFILLSSELKVELPVSGLCDPNPN